MIESMTGYARIEFEFRGEMYFAELKSLNSKGFEILLKTTQLIRNVEIPLKNLIQSKLLRGKIELNIFPIQKQDPSRIKIDESLFSEKYKELKKIADILNADSSNLFTYLLSSYSDHQVDNTIEKDEEIQIFDIMENLCSILLEYRKNEGKSIYKDLNNWIESIEKNLVKIEKLAPLRIVEKREKLLKNLQELNPQSLGIDENRLEQEILIYIEKMDISEEISRLNSHFNLYKSVINEKSNGKKLGFVCQEIGREINTIGSKASDHSIQHTVVEMKDYLERIKEQIGNVV